MKHLALLLLAGIATPLAAQTPAAPPAMPALPPVDAARLAAARPVIDQVWPLGTYQRIMRASMDQAMNGMMAGMFSMKASDMAAAVDPKAAKDTGDRTLGQLATQADPYFQERMRRSMRVMTDEMAALMTRIEPGVRDALAHAYARRFTVEQLADLSRFFATPTGQAYAADSMTLMVSPEMVAQMQQFLPEMMKAMPAIMVKVADATKDLPPPPKKKTP